MAATLVLGAPQPAGAITYGTLDNGAHPNVGAVIVRNTDGSLYKVCSGTLISPTVFLTAAHCVVPYPNETVVGVSFEATIGLVPAYHSGTPHADPRFVSATGVGLGASCCGVNDTNDTGVIVLDTPIYSITPASLPTLNLLDHLNERNGLHGVQFVAVGYGATEGVQPGAAHCCPRSDSRRVAVGTFRSLTATWLHLSQNPATGDGGGNYGDSGGPHFLGSTQIVASVESTGDMAAASRDATYRVDTPSARAFLQQYVTLP
jgi:hypothetical protein